jgi:hypothetical protein
MDAYTHTLTDMPTAPQWLHDTVAGHKCAKPAARRGKARQGLRPAHLLSTQLRSSLP